MRLGLLLSCSKVLPPGQDVSWMKSQGFIIQKVVWSSTQIREMKLINCLLCCGS